jgi:asparagine synthase (glutamine-hydrolysing)
MRSIGPIAISLSGGLDSTALAAVAATLLPQVRPSQDRLKSFSYVFDELHECDEREFIEPIVERYGLDATYIPCDEKWPLRDLARWPVDRGFVLGDPYAWLPTAVIEACRQDGCRLLLAGYYGDVLFRGGRYWALDMLREFRFKELAATLAASPADVEWRRDVFNSGLRPLIPRLFKQAWRRLRPGVGAEFRSSLHPSFIKRAGIASRIGGNGRELCFPAPGQWPRLRHLTLSVFAQGPAAVRKYYNRHNVEIEMPYQDRRLVEFVMAVPADQLARPGRDRYLHRRAMLALLPRKVRERVRRTIFFPLFEKGLLGEERAAVASILEDPLIVERQIVREDWLRSVSDQGYFRSPHKDLLWLCLCLELWLTRYWSASTRKNRGRGPEGEHGESRKPVWT